MRIQLLKTTDPNNKLDKITTSIADYTTATIKDNCDIMHPVVILPYTNTVFTANYMHIPDFNRYYYIDGIETEHQRLFIRASVDVLMSFNAEIKNISGYIERSENLQNLYMNDKAFRTQNNRLVEPKLFKNARDSFTTTGNFILVVAGPAALPPDPEPEEVL